MVKMYKRVTLLTLLALVLILVPAQLALAGDGPEEGTPTWEADRIYAPEGSSINYWITYPEVTIADIRPGKDNEFRLTIGNEMSVAQDFNVIPVVPNELAEGYSAIPDLDWISFSEAPSTEPDDPELAKAQDLLSIPANESKHIWVHVDIPRDKDYTQSSWQCTINVKPAEATEGEEGLNCTLKVNTAEDLSSKASNAWITLIILVVGICFIGGVVYMFSRWKWPNED